MDVILQLCGQSLVEPFYLPVTQRVVLSFRCWLSAERNARPCKELCGPLSDSIVLEIPYGIFQCSNTTVVTDGAVTLDIGMALVCLLYLFVITTTNRYPALVSVRGPSLSMDTNPSGPLGGITYIHF